MRPPAVHATKTSGRADLRRLCAGPRATLPQRACCAGLLGVSSRNRPTPEPTTDRASDSSWPEGHSHSRPGLHPNTPLTISARTPNKQSAIVWTDLRDHPDGHTVAAASTTLVATGGAVISCSLVRIASAGPTTARHYRLPDVGDLTPCMPSSGNPSSETAVDVGRCTRTSAAVFRWRADPSFGCWLWAWERSR
jgi:hypothetical protein